MAQRFPDDAMAAQFSFIAGLDTSGPSSKASSPEFTERCPAGSSRYQRYHTTAQPTPIAPSATRVVLHPHSASPKVTSGGPNAAPALIPAKNSPCARARSGSGIHRENACVTLGVAPDSAAPNRNRTTISDDRLQAAAVADVKADH